MKRIQDYYDSYSLGWILDHGIRYDNESGHLYLTKKEYNQLQYTGKNIDGTKKTMMLPSIHGSMLIFEHRHFTITD